MEKNMKIIISPTKKMKSKDYGPEKLSQPMFLEETRQLMEKLKSLDFQQAMDLWQCSEKLAAENFTRISEMNLEKNLSPAILTYEGIQFKYMAPDVFTDQMWQYVNEHLRILSGFYGVVRPLDGIVPYRLEMQAELSIGKAENLYEFWGNKLYLGLNGNIEQKSQIIINLASEEYSKTIEKYLKPEDKFITIVFGELKKNKEGKLQLDKEGNPKVITKGTYAKMARGEMVRFMSENQITDIEGIKEFTGGGFAWQEGLSCDDKLVFIKE